MFKQLILCGFVLLLSSCSSDCEEWRRVKTCTPVGETCTVMVPRPYSNMEQAISLQHPTTRTLVHCYTTQYKDAESCARAYEGRGFVRFRDIPYRTAKYDFLTKDTFPSRRWREGERTPRW